MISISANVLKSLVFVLLMVTGCSLAAADWPVKRKIDISDGFGDFRQNRFHAGVDIRIGGKIGESIFSPVDGSVYRIKTSYEGYGKGLYILGNDGYIYVYAHLYNFNGDLDKLIKENQIAAKRYYQDIFFPKDSIKIKKGDFLGYGGQTGTSAPHIHFEIRTADNFPINPLKNGFEIADKIRPTFRTIGFKQLDDHSLFNNGHRKLDFPVSYNSSTGEYQLDTLLYFHRSFVINTEVFDQMRSGGMKQAVYKLSLKIDGKLYYQIVFDTVDFDTQRGVNFEYEYLKAVNNEKNILRLYSLEGNSYRGSVSPNGTDGICGLDKTFPIGYHKAEITAEDCFNNKSKLTFDFIWGSDNYIYNLDSLVTVKSKDNYFYFTPIDEWKQLKIDSVLPYVNQGTKWGMADRTEVEYLENGQIKCKIVGAKTHKTTIKLFVFSKNSVIQDNLFNGILPKGKPLGEMTYEIVEDGLLIKLDINSRVSAEARIELYYQDSLLGIEYPQHFNMREYYCFIPPKKEYAFIDRISYAMSRDSSYKTDDLHSLRLFVVGYEDNQDLRFSNMILTFNKNTFYRPQFIEIKKSYYMKQLGARFYSSPFKIYPEAFICKEDFKVSFDLKQDNKFNSQAGICWLDEEKEKWVWLDTELDGLHIRANSTGGGTFAALYDLEGPKISRLSIVNGKTYTKTKPNINFILEDQLSGIKDDQSILVRLDNKWMIPEYDRSTNRFKTKPIKPLEHGMHHIGIEIVDRAGNKFEQYLQFFVKIKKPKK